MKKFLLIICVALFGGAVFAQDNMTQLAKDLPQSMYLNPAMRPDRSFLSVPIIGGFQVGVSNSFSYGDIFSKRNGANYLNSSALISSTAAANSGMDIGLNIDLLNTGFYVTDEDFIGVSVRTRISSANSYPSDAFRFLLNNPLTNTSDMFNMRMDANITGWAEVGLSYSRPIGDNVVIGARFKYIGGLASLQTRNGIRFDVKKEYDRYILSGDYEIMAGNINFGSKGGVQASDIMSGLASNPGFGVDLGISVTSNDQKINVTAAVSDFGYIFWNAKNSSRLVVRNPNEKFEFDGMGDLMGGNIDLGKGLDSVFQKFSRIVGVDTISGVGFSTQLPLTFQTSFNYSIDDYFRHNVSFGAIGSLPYRGGFNYALSVGYAYRTLNGMWQLMANYTYSNFNPYGVGLGVVFTAGPFQAYFATDDIIPLFDLANARRASARVAFNFFFNRR